MKKYKIKLKSHGFTYWYSKKVKNINSYDSLEDVPSFDINEHPVTEGLKLLEKSGKLEIVDVTPKSKREETTDEEVADEEVTDEEVADEEVTDEETIDEETTDEETTDEEVADEEVADEEVADEEVADEETIDEVADEENYTRSELEDMTVSELDDLAKEMGLSGYSSLVKAEKIDLILES